MRVLKPASRSIKCQLCGTARPYAARDARYQDFQRSWRNNRAGFEPGCDFQRSCRNDGGGFGNQ
eukprot:2876487-Rhodomonas_salina.1